MRVSTEDVKYVRGDPSSSTMTQLICFDLLEARELIEQMRELLELNTNAILGCECDFCEKQRAIIEKSKNYI